MQSPGTISGQLIAADGVEQLVRPTRTQYYFCAYVIYRFGTLLDQQRKRTLGKI